MRDFEEVRESILPPAFSKGLPFQVFDHLRGISCLAVTAIHKPGTTTLYSLNFGSKTGAILFVGVFVDGGVPDTASVLDLRPDKGLVGKLTRGVITDPNVSLQHTDGLAGFGRNILDVGVPFEVGLNGDAEILNAVIRGAGEQGSVEVVVLEDWWFALTAGDGQDLTLTGVELHEPGFFPFADIELWLKS